MLADVRDDFPLLARTVRNGRPLVYLDSGATAQRPRAVLEAEADFLTRSNGAVARGAHLLAEEATEAFEGARADVARLVGAPVEEIVWTSGATAAINLVANGIQNATLGAGGAEADRFRIGPGDRIVVTELEHHANLIPWQQLAARTGAELAWIPVDDAGVLDLSTLAEIVSPSTKVVAFTHASNVTGVITDVAAIVARAHEVGALTVLDACQSVPHIPVSFPELGVDFAAFSGHKMLGPTGVGALWGRKELLDALPPSIFGGGAIAVVTMERTTWLEAPTRFEPGTQPVSQAVGMGAAARYLMSLGMENVAAHEARIAQIMREGAASLDGVRLLGPVGGPAAGDVLGLAAVAVEGVHAHDVGQVLDDRGIAARVGHHCAQPLHRRLGLTGSTRASAHVYTTEADAHAFVEALASVRSFFGVTA
ncbi:aminotransferase class V-fold PLP-dependent enzyme [Demequina lignilytica]|uniref:Cysteine desulfurase n=1 Tax=Demequina lignilytica TaxID=3051663 RepID=A0AB35MKP4_9MICO|nr:MULTISPECIES: SufS family cysteine desulfurase [unclassified Demequina]MDN4484384.1 SufS family cysteine desulfurase [Demequina sp. SYSU T0a273]MDN4491291.1 SufS family cysteine desulfurase [Demequina sp. SYSU T00068]